LPISQPVARKFFFNGTHKLPLTSSNDSDHVVNNNNDGDGNGDDPDVYECGAHAYKVIMQTMI
jgi:hypothetical protein